MAGKTTFDPRKARIDRVVAGKRYQIRTGATTLAEHKARKAIFDKLAEAGKLDVLDELQAGKIDFPRLRHADDKGVLKHDGLLIDNQLDALLFDVLDEDGAIVTEGALSRTLPKMGKEEETRDDYAKRFRQLMKAWPTTRLDRAKVADLKTQGPAFWPKVFAKMDELGMGPVSRNRVRSAVSAFCTQYMDGEKFHPFRLAVMKVMVTKNNEKREYEPETIRQVSEPDVEKLLDALAPEVQRVLLVLGASGLRIGTFLSCTKESIRHLPLINYPSSKKKGGQAGIAPEYFDDIREAVKWSVANAPTLAKGQTKVKMCKDPRYGHLRRRLAEACAATGVRCTLHYLRHYFSKACHEAGIPVPHIQQALDQTTPGMAGKYAKHADITGAALQVGKRMAKHGLKVRIPADAKPVAPISSLIGKKGLGVSRTLN